MSEIPALLDKAARSFGAAGQLLRGGNPDFAASRAYYGYFYVAEALLLSKDTNFSRHGQVIARYGRHFAKTEKSCLPGFTGSCAELLLCDRQQITRRNHNPTRMSWSS